jgi:hypothetical protein
MAENMWHELLSKVDRKVRPRIRELPHFSVDYVQLFWKNNV